MRYPEYMFFPLGGLGEEWWESYPETITPCSHSEIAEMVKGTLSIVSEGFTLNQDTSVNTTSGQVYHTIHNMYFAKELCFKLYTLCLFKNHKFC